MSNEHIDAVRFRGEFLSHFASIEDSLAPALARLVSLGEAKRPPHLFGQKFELARKSGELPGLWKHPKQVMPLLDKISPFAANRGVMCHAIIEEVTDAHGGRYFLIRPPGKQDWDRRTLSVDEAGEQLRTLKELAEKLTRQVLAGS